MQRRRPARAGCAPSWLAERTTRMCAPGPLRTLALDGKDRGRAHGCRSPTGVRFLGGSPRQTLVSCLAEKSASSSRVPPIGQEARGAASARQSMDDSDAPPDAARQFGSRPFEAALWRPRPRGLPAVPGCPSIMMGQLWRPRPRWLPGCPSVPTARHTASGGAGGQPRGAGRPALGTGWREGCMHPASAADGPGKTQCYLADGPGVQPWQGRLGPGGPLRPSLLPCSRLAVRAARGRLQR